MKNGSTIDKVNWALHRVVTQAKPEKLGNATWVLSGAVGTLIALFVNRQMAQER